MEKIFTSYVDKDFLMGFLEYGRHLSVWETGDKVDIWRSLHKFLREKTKLAFSGKFDDIKTIEPSKRQSLLLRVLKKINRSLEEKAKSKESVEDNEFHENLAYAPQSTMLKSVIDSYFQGVEDIEYVDQLPEEPDDISFSTIEHYNFIFTASDSYLDIEKRFGVAVLPKNGIFSNWKLYAGVSKISIPDREQNQKLNGWRILQDFKHPINAFLLTDRFLFSYYWNIENNLLPLLKVLLSGQNLDIPLDLTILTEKIYNNNRTNQEEDCGIIYNRIDQYLKNELGFKLVNLTFCKVPGHLGPRIHNRQIFTNYFFIASELGFGCFDQYGQSALPESLIIPLSPVSGFESNNKDVHDLLIKNRRVINDPQTTVIGANKNRLYDSLGDD